MRKSFLYVLCLVVAYQLIGCGSGEEQRGQLAELEEQNHSGQPMLNDSLAEALVAYFDRHGSANERMRAKYILGRTYADMGELPRALETYFEAADCADTTASDCDFAKLSRVHAQSADIFHKQIQPRSELKQLRLAEYYAIKGNDTLMAIECYALQAGAYKYLEKYDSVISITEKASFFFNDIGRKDRSVQVLTNDVSSLLKKGEITKAMRQIFQYEMFSGYFNSDKEIAKSREMFYYLKGKCYLEVNKIDSAEYLFRKLLAKDKRINSQIAANKGLLEVYEKRAIADSVAKFAKVSYALNDSAYLLSEMQNIQKLQASYNYEHAKLLAEQKSHESERAYLIIAIIVSLVMVAVVVAFYAFSVYRRKNEEELRQYRSNLFDLEKAQTELQELMAIETLNAASLIEKKNQEFFNLQESIAKYHKLDEKHIATLENRLDDADITKHLHDLVDKNPPQIATLEDFRQLKMLVNEEIPSFYSALNTPECSLRTIEYEVCLLIRCHFLPSEICKLTGRNESYISNLKKAILLKLYGVKGSPKDLDQRIMTIK
ncbi:MAG: hypothetical protein IJ159_05085 [Prevotella sp.]|nr:hypothetical protein [Prevotella sp.]